MDQITINVSFYGELAKFVSGRSVYNTDFILPKYSNVKYLLETFKIPFDQQGYTFINAVLCDMPGLGTSHHEVLSDGDHIGIFSTKYVWPFQYRNGAPISDALRAALIERGVMHHTY